MMDFKCFQIHRFYGVFFRIFYEKEMSYLIFKNSFLISEVQPGRIFCHIIRDVSKSSKIMITSRKISDQTLWILFIFCSLLQ